MTVGEALAGRRREHLAAAGRRHARGVDAELLVAHALGARRASISTLDHDRPLSDGERDAAARARRRRGAREPLAYVLGEWGFRRLTLTTDRRVLVPRPETEIVVERCLELLRRARRAARARRRHGLRRDRARDRRRAPGRARDRDRRLDGGARARARERERARASTSSSVERATCDDGLGGPLRPRRLEPAVRAAEEIDALEPEVRDREPRDALVGDGAHRAIAARRRRARAGRLARARGRATARRGEVAELLASARATSDVAIGARPRRTRASGRGTDGASTRPSRRSAPGGR